MIENIMQETILQERFKPRTTDRKQFLVHTYSACLRHLTRKLLIGIRAIAELNLSQLHAWQFYSESQNIFFWIATIEYFDCFLTIVFSIICNKIAFWLNFRKAELKAQISMLVLLSKGSGHLLSKWWSPREKVLISLSLYNS